MLFCVVGPDTTAPKIGNINTAITTVIAILVALFNLDFAQAYQTKNYGQKRIAIIIPHHLLYHSFCCSLLSFIFFTSSFKVFFAAITLSPYLCVPVVIWANRIVRYCDKTNAYTKQQDMQNETMSFLYTCIVSGLIIINVLLWIIWLFCLTHVIS